MTTATSNISYAEPIDAIPVDDAPPSTTSTLPASLATSTTDGTTTTTAPPTSEMTQPTSSDALETSSTSTAISATNSASSASTATASLQEGSTLATTSFYVEPARTRPPTTTEAAESTTEEASTTTSLLQASCRLTLAGDVLQSEAEMQSHVVTSLAEALQVPQSHLRNVVVQLGGRRLAAAVRTLRVDYEILVTGAVKPLLQKVMDLTDAGSDTFSRFSHSLAEDANVEIRSVELLDVPHV
ncbi:unnamed protein product, partial [Symbiodinium sp. CCMP2456]